MAFVEDLPAALERGKKLQRSQMVAVGVAHACAAIVDVALAAPDSGAATTAAVGKAALKVWESLAVISGSGGIPATLLATCCKVRPCLLASTLPWLLLNPSCVGMCCNTKLIHEYCICHLNWQHDGPSLASVAVFCARDVRFG